MDPLDILKDLVYWADNRPKNFDELEQYRQVLKDIVKRARECLAFNSGHCRNTLDLGGLHFGG